ncbi:MAG: NAD(+)/NADH kinase [Chloroflexi bacterium]|nr:NAD(+)/NADH kinase [Chloroflexota bacterium]
MSLRQVGLIVNPTAGGGDGLAAAREALRALAPREVLAGAGEMGADALAHLPVTLRTVDWSPHHGKARTAWLAREFAAQGVDALVVVGGDGTLADVAFALSSQTTEPGRAATPICGVGVGSANVGPLVTCLGHETERLAGAHFERRAVDGLLVGANSDLLGLAFNDVVIGFTVLATVAGGVTDVDAAQKMQGRNVPRAPEAVWTERTRVAKYGSRGETLIATGVEAATVIVGLPDERFYGKAIAGGVLLSSLVGDPAGCLACSHLIVRTQLDADELRRTEPIVTRYAGLCEDERVEGWGFRAGAALCADGNPLRLLNANDRATIRVRRGLATALAVT